jgi:hypothetical protein
MLRVDYIDNFETKALDAIRDLSGDAERVDIAVAFLSYRGWVELKPTLTAVVGRGGQLRVIVRRDVRQNSAEAVEELFHLPNAQVAFELADTAFHPKDYLFHAGEKLTVLTSSANATYPGLTHNVEGGAIITHSIPTLVPGEQVSISYLYLPPVTWQNINSYAKSDECMARVISLVPRPQPNKLVLFALWLLLFIGASTVIYWLILQIAAWLH